MLLKIGNDSSNLSRRITTLTSDNDQCQKSFEAFQTCLGIVCYLICFKRRVGNPDSLVGDCLLSDSRGGSEIQKLLKILNDLSNSIRGLIILSRNMSKSF